MEKEHPYVERYRKVWERTLKEGGISSEQREKSRYYFEKDLANPTPKEFEVFSVAALLPMPEEAQKLFTDLWGKIIDSLGNPLAYAVKPMNRHVELILFSRPEEVFQAETIRKNIDASYNSFKSNPPKSFKVKYKFPFITPDGTVVVPGFPLPENAIDDFRENVNKITNGAIPKLQSQWFHTPLGRILDPIDQKLYQSTLKELEDHWGEDIMTLEINELYWMHEMQWYMVKKETLHKLFLK